jgi:hypothetical protein
VLFSDNATYNTLYKCANICATTAHVRVHILVLLNIGLIFKVVVLMSYTVVYTISCLHYQMTLKCTQHMTTKADAIALLAR